MRRFWTPSEDALLKRCCGCKSAFVLARLLSRSVKSIYTRTCFLGLTRRKFRWSRSAERIIRQGAARGECDRHLAATLHCERRVVGDWRSRLGLPRSAGQTTCRKCRRETAQRTREQLSRTGLATLADVRLQSWSDSIANRGWPEGLRPWEGKILDALSRLGPMTRREIAAAIGYPWPDNQRKAFSCQRPGGSCLAYLIRLGLLVKLPGRPGTVLGHGHGKSGCVYSLSFNVERREVS